MSKIDSNSTIFLIDGSTFIFRAYYAMYKASQARGNGFTRSDGTPTGAVMAFCNMMWKIITNGIDGIFPTHIAVIFDTKEKTFRSEIYPDYKANRDAPPEDLIPQFPLIHKAVEAFNIKALSLDGYEADDLIATYAEIAKGTGAQTIIISGDKDLMQLINDNVVMYDPMPGRERFINREGVQEKFGVFPEKVVDIQALAGDATDNIPGVPGIGIKIASELINEYGDLEKLLNNAQNIKQQKRRENLIEYSDSARISYKLALLDTKTPIKVEINDLEYNPLNYEKIASFSREMELKNLINRVDAWFKNKNETETNDTSDDRSSLENRMDEKSEGEDLSKKEGTRDYMVSTKTQFLDLINKIKLEEKIALSINYYSEKKDLSKQSIAISSNGVDVYLINLTKDIDNISSTEIFLELKKIFEDASIRKIFYGLKDMLPYLYSYNINVKSFDDLSLMSYVLNNGKNKHDFQSLCDTYSSNLVTPIPTQIIDTITIEAHEKIRLIYKIWETLNNEMITKGVIEVYETIEKPLIKILSAMEQNGIKADIKILDELSLRFQEKIIMLEKEIIKDAGVDFNIASPKQLGEILFDVLKLDGGKKTKSGVWATGIEILEDLSLLGYGIADNIIEWRQLTKLKSTYTDSIPHYINKNTGRVHTTFSQALTSTGRLSSSSPNLQNIPIRTPEGKLIRSAFISEKNHYLISADYSQIELRVLAHIAEIDPLREAFKNDLDIHAMTASSIFNIPLEDVNKTLRYRAKAINFGIIYGISAFGLSKQLKITRKEAQKFIIDYFNRFPGIKEYMNNTIDFARKNLYVSTIFGRNCHFPEIISKNHAVRSFNERAAINAPIQGSAADIIKKAMVKISQEIKANNLKSKMILQIHDELMFETPEEEVKIIEDIIIENMESATNPQLDFSVPLKVDVKVSKSWEE